MSEILKLEDNANSLLKKLSELLDNLSSNLSKEKTEKALDDGNECINEIENIIKQISNITIDNYSKNNLFIIKGDLKQKKENFEKIQEKYILNKSNQLIEEQSFTTQEEDKDIEVYGQNERDMDENKNENLSDSENNNPNEKDLYSNININLIEKDVYKMENGYLNENYNIKRRIQTLFNLLLKYKNNDINYEKIKSFFIMVIKFSESSKNILYYYKFHL